MVHVVITAIQRTKSDFIKDSLKLIHSTIIINFFIKVTLKYEF